ncbi:hypothetical protein DBP21_03415 [Streptomyces sp. CS147]|nr:hypothetical protein DBP21_03415 [Streptomyces sp. CS147]
MVLVVVAVVGMLSYTASTFATQIGADWIAHLSPFHYCIGGEPLRNGFQWGDAAVLVIQRIRSSTRWTRGGVGGGRGTSR